MKESCPASVRAASGDVQGPGTGFRCMRPKDAPHTVHVAVLAEGKRWILWTREPGYVVFAGDPCPRTQGYLDDDGELRARRCRMHTGHPGNC